MDLKPLDEQQGADRSATLTQANTKAWARQLERNPLLGGHLLGGVALTGAANTTVDHLLGTQIRGWIVTDVVSLAGAPVIYRVAWDQETLTVLASVACTVDLWVF